MEFKFVTGTAPDEETINNMHRELAKGLINKYGKEVIEKVLKQIDKQA